MTCIYCAWPHDSGHSDSCPVTKIEQLDEYIERLENTNKTIDANWTNAAAGLAYANDIIDDLRRLHSEFMFPEDTQAFWDAMRLVLGRQSFKGGLK